MVNKKKTIPDSSTPIDATSPLYAEIVAEFLIQVATEDSGIPLHVVEGLRTVFATGAPSSDELIDVFRRDDEPK